MRSAAAVVFVAALAGAQESRPESRPCSRPAAESRVISLGDVVDSARGLLARLSGEAAGYERGVRISGEAMALQRSGRPHEAIALLEAARSQVRGGVLPPGEFLFVLGIVSVHFEESDYEAAVEVAEDFGRTATDEEDQKNVWTVVAITNERVGNWNRAADAWERVSPERAVWGPIGRLLKLARCRFELGQVEVSLGLVEHCLKDETVAIPRYEGGSSHAPEAAWAYAEYAARSGHRGRAIAFVRSLPPDVRAACFDCFTVVDAWIARDPAAFVDAVARSRFDSKALSDRGILLATLGEPALDLLRARIAGGHVVAIELAGESRRPELLPALEARDQSDAATEAERQALAIAIYNLERVRPAPTSRQASRPASRASK
jgi:hypothetical protein